ncbi:RDD family protein [Candidatus Woesearchaeota archaeon]|nr:RDD family protein [Candidatus Woesearchaeota archaeon]
MKNLNKYLDALITPQMTKTFLLPASIWKRAGAFIIDIALLDLIVFSPFKANFASLIAGADSYQKAFQMLTASQENLSSLMMASFFIAILTISYFTILEWKLGQTVGKILFNLFLVQVPANQDEKLSKPGFWQVFTSNLSLVPFFPFIFLWPVEILSILFTNNRFMERVAKIQLIEIKIIDYYQSDV